MATTIKISKKQDKNVLGHQHAKEGAIVCMSLIN